MLKKGKSTNTQPVGIDHQKQHISLMIL